MSLFKRPTDTPIRKLVKRPRLPLRGGIAGRPRLPFGRPAARPVAGAERFVARPDGRRPLTWRSWVGLVLVPALLGGLVLWAFWRPTEHLDRVTAAIVNEDEPVEVQGQLAPLGRELAGKLVARSSDNLTWVLSDRADATEGLKKARYAAVLTIPKEFSKAATSSSDPDTATQAVLDLSGSTDAALLDSQLSKSVAQSATSVFNATMAQTHIENVYLGFSTLHTRIGEAAAGAGEVAKGSHQLAVGLTQLGAGTANLQSGTRQLSAGANQLASGIDQLGSGTGRLTSGADQLTAMQGSVVSGMTQISSGAAQLSSHNAALAAAAAKLGPGATEVGKAGVGLADEFTRTAVGLTGLSTASAQLRTGTAALANGLDQLTEAARPMPDSARELATGATRVADGTAGVVAKLKAGKVLTVSEIAQLQDLSTGARAVATGNAKLAAGLGQLATGLGDSAAGAHRVDAGTGQVAAGAPALSRDATRLTADAKRFATATEQLAADTGSVTAGATKLVTAGKSLSGDIEQAIGGVRAAQAVATQIASGARELDSGTGQLLSGARQLSTAATEVDRGVGTLATGVTQLSAGATQLDAGTGELAAAMTTAAKSVPAYDASQRRDIAKVAASPVTIQGIGSSVDDKSTLGFFATLALWAGALATYIVLAAAPSWVRTSRRTTTGLVRRNVLGIALLAVAQASLLAGVAWRVGDLSPRQTLALWAGLAAIALTFLLVNAALAGLFGNFGRLVSAVVLVVTLVGGMWSGPPPVITAVLGVLPSEGALRTARALLSGGNQLGPGLLLLGVWALIGVVALVLVTERRRRFRPVVPTTSARAASPALPATA